MSPTKLGEKFHCKLHVSNTRANYIFNHESVTASFEHGKKNISKLHVASRMNVYYHFTLRTLVNYTISRALHNY